LSEKRKTQADREERLKAKDIEKKRCQEIQNTIEKERLK